MWPKLLLVLLGTGAALAIGQYKVATSSGTTCVVQQGRSFCFGYNGFSFDGIFNHWGVCAQDSDADSIGTTAAEMAALKAVGFKTSAQVLQISGGAGGIFFCALFAAGVRCWGSNSGGQLGTGSAINYGCAANPMNTLDYIQFKNSPTVSSIGVGDNHACAVFSTGRAVCWGSNNAGQLGTGSTASINNPLTHDPISMGSTLNAMTISQITAGESFTCALFSEGSVVCWGTVNAVGTMAGDNVGDAGGEMENLQFLQFTAGAGALTLSKIASGSSHSCGLFTSSTEGKLICWGTNGSGQLGQGDSKPRGASAFSGIALELADFIPFEATATKVIDVACGGQFSCAVFFDGKVRCWGNPFMGALGFPGAGDGIGDSANEMVNLQALAFQGTASPVTAISAGNDYACSVHGTEGVRCWGDGFNGNLGLGRIDVIGDTSGELVAISTITLPICGDGVKAAWEVCDDGNVDNGDFCNSDCSSGTGSCLDGTNRVICPAGYVCDGTVNTVCPTTGSTTGLCPRDQYCPEGSLAGTDCPDDLGTPSEGATAATQCTVQYCTHTWDPLDNDFDSAETNECTIGTNTYCNSDESDTLRTCHDGSDGKPCGEGTDCQSGFCDLDPEAGGTCAPISQIDDVTVAYTFKVSASSLCSVSSGCRSTRSCALAASGVTATAAFAILEPTLIARYSEGPEYFYISGSCEAAVVDNAATPMCSAKCTVTMTTDSAAVEPEMRTTGGAGRSLGRMHATKVTVTATGTKEKTFTAVSGALSAGAGVTPSATFSGNQVATVKKTPPTPTPTTAATTTTTTSAATPTPTPVVTTSTVTTPQGTTTTVTLVAPIATLTTGTGSSTSAGTTFSSTVVVPGIQGVTVQVTIVGTVVDPNTPQEVISQITQNTQAVSSCQSDALCKSQMTTLVTSAVGSLTVSAVQQQFPTSVVKVTDPSTGGTPFSFAVIAISFTVENGKPNGVTGLQAVDFQVKTAADGSLTAVVSVTAAMIRVVPEDNAGTFGAVNRRGSRRLDGLQAASAAASSTVDLFPGTNIIDVYNKRTGALVKTMEIARATVGTTSSTLSSTSSSSSSGHDAAAIGGGIGGALAGLLLIGIGLAVYLRSRNSRTGKYAREQLPAPRSRSGSSSSVPSSSSVSSSSVSSSSFTIEDGDETDYYTDDYDSAVV